jgi:hypothetical protein
VRVVEAVRVRVRTAALLAACVFGVAVLLSGPARAAEPSVGFTGGCGLLGIGATSLPDTSALTVTAGSGLRVVNHLGVSATVLVDGRGVDTVPAGHSARLTLAAAETTTVRLAPVCPAPLLSLSGILTVAVTTEAPPVTGSPSAGPTGAPSAPPTTAPPAAPGSATPRPQPTPATPGPDASAPAPVGATGPAQPSAIRRSSGSPASTARAVAAAVAPEVELPGTVPLTPTGLPLRANQPYIGPVTPLGADRAARYSLALIATVLILGTGLAALRLLHSQRHVGAHRRVP